MRLLKEKITKICDAIIECGILAIVFFVPVIFDASVSSYNFFDLYKVIFFRFVLILALLAFVAKIFISGKLNYKGSAKIFLFAAVLPACFFASSLLSVDPEKSLWGSFLRQQGFYNFFHYALFFILLVLNIGSFAKIKRIIISAAASSFFVSAYGLAQYLNLDPLVWDESAFRTGRIFSTLGQPNFFGHWLIMVLPLTIYCVFFIAKKALARFFACLILFMQFACLILTYSRAAWIGFLCSMFFLAVFWLLGKRRKKVVFVLICLAVVGAMIVAGLNMAHGGEANIGGKITMANRIQSIIDFQSGSGKMRMYYMRAAAEEMKQASALRIFFGYGPEVLDRVFMKYYAPDWGVHEAINSVPDRAHNWIFDQILSFGVLGLLANLLFYFYIVRKAFVCLPPRSEAEAGAENRIAPFLLASLAAYCVNNLFSFSMFVNFVYLFLIATLLWIQANLRSNTVQLNIRLSLVSKLLIWFFLFAACAAFGANGINQVKAEIRYAGAIEAVAHSDCDRASDNMREAIRLNSRSGYYEESNLFLALNCFFKTASGENRKKILENMIQSANLLADEKSYGALHNAARAYSLFGFYFDQSYYKKAEKIFSGLIADFPYFTAVYEDFAKQKIAQSDYEGAIKILDQAIGVLPSADNAYLNDQHRGQISDIAARLREGLGNAHFQMKNYAAAIDNYAKALKFDPYRATSYKSMADAYYAMRDLDKAIALNKRGFALNPSDFHWPLALWFLCKEKQDVKQAEKYFRQAVELSPENAEFKQERQ